jgi:hypothetical protein
MFKKALLSIIGITFILSIIMPFTSVRAANITLSIKNQTATSATIAASGMIPGVVYQFKVTSVGLDSTQDQVKQVTASPNGTAEATFSNLILHHSYRFYLFEYNTQTQSAITPSVAYSDEFQMGSNFGPVTLSIKNQTSNSVTLSASGMIPSITYQFKVTSVILDNSQDQVKQVTASSNGTAEITFSNLILHRSYTFYVFEYDTQTQSIKTPSVINIDFRTGENTLNNLCSSSLQIISFSPTSGKVGDTITITGNNFIGVNNIYFGTTKAITTTNSPTQITVKVPTGATSGKIKIETTNYGNAISASDFTVSGTSTTGKKDTSTTSNESKNISDDPICASVSKKVEFKGLVPVCNTVVDSNGGYCDPCDFNMVMNIINKIITFVLITLATPLFALIIIYTAWLYLSAGGSSENVTKAKKIFKNAIIGYIIALAAWLIVRTILSSLGVTDTDIMFLG